ncbi:PAS domain S-box protein [Paraflavitalea sp. CAU 1676]|uniref:sensor histidine kinase n=1 Tax=Paraflavitalea sp. CAU 1676 TaxID=3032598 RepID=UPI0023DBC49C|nr:PAS domain S-box protein [Paraflavitalea sp. CAU 1676]MDF2189614.1 PAS domain S-box protein [Paraflavitalea sp. CAU 1676]
MNDDAKARPESNSHLKPAIDGYYEQLFRLLPVALYSCNKEGFITEYNAAAVALWGREPVIGRDRWIGSLEIYKLDGTRLQPEESPMARAITTGSVNNVEEIAIVRADGTRRIILSSPRLIYDNDGHLAGAVNMLNDITERKLTEDKMAHLAAIVASSDDAIVSKTLDGIITSWNDAAERILGYTAAEVIGKPITMLIPPDRLQEEPQIIDRLKKGERVDHFETKRITKQGKVLDVSLTISPVKSNDGRIIGASKILRDITEQKEIARLIKEAEDRFKVQLEQKVEERTGELLAINEELGRSNHELEQYAYIASHDLQEPLRKIQTFADLLRSNLDDPDAVEAYLAKINTSARRMASLIKDVLNYSKLSRSENVWGEVDLNLVLQDVKNDFELLIEQKLAIVSVSQLPLIRGDQQQLRQLFGNLLSNALKFCENAPRIEVRCTNKEILPDSMEYTLAPGTYAVITFGDNGIGFDQKYADQIFVVFKRLNNRHYYSGTGIGLALCKKIVERHKGFISVQSKPGVGTNFTILFPAQSTPQ